MTNDELSFASEAALTDPYPVYARLRERSPVHWDEWQQAWLVTRYDYALQVLRDDERYSAAADMSFMDQLPADLQREAEPLRHHFAAWIVFSDPPRHTKLRTLTKSYLMPDSVRRARDVLAERADRLLAAADRAGGMDALNDYAVPLAQVALAELMGLREKDLFRAKEWSDELLTFVNVDPTEEQTRRSLANLLELTDFVREWEGSGAIRPDTLADILSRARRAGDVDDIEVVATYAQNITGSLGPVPHLIGNGLLALLENPDQLHQLRADPELLPLAVDEMLRYDSPFLIIPRTARTATRLGDVDIAAGDRVGLMIGAVNHDPRVFLRPGQLDISRRPNRHLSFGLGRHHCLGLHVTRDVTRAAISALLDRFEDIELELTPRRQPFFGMRMLRSLPLRVRGRRPVTTG
jgi:pimeloyl-[acyl-carrier protein] synthase